MVRGLYCSVSVLEVVERHNVLSAHFKGPRLRAEKQHRGGVEFERAQVHCFEERHGGHLSGTGRVRRENRRANPIGAHGEAARSWVKFRTFNIGGVPRATEILRSGSVEGAQFIEYRGVESFEVSSDLVVRA